MTGTPTNFQRLEQSFQQLAESVKDLQKHLADSYMPRAETQLQFKIFSDLVAGLAERVAELERWRHDGTKDANDTYTEIRKEISDLRGTLTWFIVVSLLAPLVFLVVAHFLWIK